MPRLARRTSEYWLALSTLAVVSAAWSKQASACSPVPGAVHTAIPSDGGHPANAAILLSGASLSVYNLVATIDDAPATIVIDETASEWSLADDAYTTLSLRLQPEPIAGQTVSLAGNPCAYEFGPNQDCDSFEVTYVAEESDEVAPAGPDDWWWDAQFVTNPPEAFLPNGSCEDMDRLGDLTVHHTFADAQDVEDSAALFVRIWSTPASRSRDYVPRLRQVQPGETESLWLPLYMDQAPYPVLENPACVHLEVVDLAGNSSGISELCEPCSVQYALAAQCYPETGHCGSAAPQHLKSEDCYTLPVVHDPDSGALASPSDDGGWEAGDVATESETPGTEFDASVTWVQPDAGNGPAVDGQNDSESAGANDERAATLEVEQADEAGALTEHVEPDAGDSAPTSRETDASNVHEPRLKPAASSNAGGCAVAAWPLNAPSALRNTSSTLALVLAFAMFSRRRR